MAEYVYETERVGDYIVQVVNDPFPMNPRKDIGENITEFYGDHRRYEIGDGKPPSEQASALERGGIRLLYRYLRRFHGVVAFAKVGMYDHGSVAYYTEPIDPPSKGTHWQDPQGWDSGTVGYAYVTRARAEELGAPLDSLDKQIEDEVKEYGAWANGDVYGYEVVKACTVDHEDDSDETIAACPHSETVDSCYGFIGEADYALSEGKDIAESLWQKVLQGA